jgi:hypothetical protein
MLGDALGIVDAAEHIATAGHPVEDLKLKEEVEKVLVAAHGRRRVACLGPFEDRTRCV